MNMSPIYQQNLLTLHKDFISKKIDSLLETFKLQGNELLTIESSEFSEHMVHITYNGTANLRKVGISLVPYDNGETTAIVFYVNTGAAFPSSKTRHYQSTQVLASKELAVNLVTCCDRNNIVKDIHDFLKEGIFNPS